MAITYEETTKFNKSFKKLSRKYKTLSEDFLKLKNFSINLFHDTTRNFDNKGIVLIPGFKHSQITIYKVRKFACRSLKGGAMSGLRVIYAHHVKTNKIEFIEIYYKGNQSNHSESLIKSYLNTHQRK